MDLLKNSSTDITSKWTTSSSWSTSSPKVIVFQPDDKKHCFETNKANATVIGSIGQHDHGSSKVKLKSIVDYKWEVKNYPGRLIAVHLAGKHIAYAIKVNNKEGKSEGMVRVVDSTNGFRALIKGMSSEVLDLEFANLKGTIILGCIEKGAIHVHQIENLSDKIICTLLVKIEDTGPEIHSLNNQIKWCPYVPADETTIDDEYVGKQLVWVRGNTYECYSIHLVVEAYEVGTHLSKNVKEGCLSHKETTNITCAVYSPDGTTLCVSCDDGHVRFYQVYFHTNESNPRRIHEWIPHNGKKVTSLFFLDNHTKCISDNSLWKHAITASDNNTEIKIWCCSTWNCLQTINFKTPSNVPTEFIFKAEIDRTSSYLILSDIKNRGLYALQIIKDLDMDDDYDLDSTKIPLNDLDKNIISNTATTKAAAEPSSSTTIKSQMTTIDVTSAAAATMTTTISTPATAATNGKELSGTSMAYIKSIAEFPLSWPILSFGIVDAAVRKYKCAFGDSYLADELDDYDEENHALICVVIHMFIVQPKSVQECHVLYQPMVGETIDVSSSISSDGFKDLKNTSIVTNSGSLSEDKTTDKINASDISDIKHQAPPLCPTSSSSSIDASNILTSPKQSGKQSSSDSVGQHQNLIGTQSTKSITLVTPDSFHSPGKITPEISGSCGNGAGVINNSGDNVTTDKFYSTDKSEGVSNEVLNTLRMLAKAPDIRQKTVENKNLLNLVNNKVIEEQEQQKLRQSSEAITQKLVQLPSAPLLPATGHSQPQTQQQQQQPSQQQPQHTSGGSSPSREVQEILSLKDSDCLNEFYDVPIDLSDENDGESDDNKQSGASESYNLNDNPCDSNKNETKLSGVSKKSEWPTVPNEPPIMIASKYNNINSTPVLNNNNVLTEINIKMDQLLEAIQTQTCQISELKNEIMELQKKNTADTHKYDQFTKTIEFRLSKLIEEYLIRYERENNKRLEIIIAARDNQSDKLLHSMGQMVITQIHERISQTIITELQQNILPLLASKLDGIKAQVHADIVQNFNSMDLLFKENIPKIYTNKETLAALSNAMIVGIPNSFQKTYSETLKTILIPAYEKSSQEMFKQIQHVFLQGTKSYIQHFDTFIGQYQPGQEELVTLLNGLPEQLKTVTTTALTNVSTQLQTDLTKDIRSLQTNLVKSLRDNIKNEMQKGFETQAGTIEESVLSVVRSQAQTPAPSIFDVQEQIKSLLAQGQINAAFHQALVANDLNLVEYTLEKADFHTVFNPCQLQQTVLLSLIQQISADMTNHNEIKQKYLADAILNLNLRDATTKEHAPKIMRELYQHCQNFTECNATSPLCSGVRMLMMAIQGLGLKSF